MRVILYWIIGRVSTRSYEAYDFVCNSSESCCWISVGLIIVQNLEVQYLVMVYNHITDTKTVWKSYV